MARKDFRGFRPKADRSTFKPAGETRQAFVERVHGKVLEAESIAHLWQVYYRNRFELQSSQPFEPAMTALLKEVFYSGVASMFQLMNKASEGGDSEAEIETGAEKLQRLYEELETYTRGLR